MAKLIEIEAVRDIVAAVRKKYYPGAGVTGSRYSEAVQALDEVGYALRDYTPPDSLPNVNVEPNIGACSLGD